MISNSDFFETKDYFIDQRVIPFEMYNYYQIFNNKRENIGFIRQKLTIGKEILKFIFGKAIVPFVFEIKSANGALEASITKGWSLLSSRIMIRDKKGNKIGTIKKKYKFHKTIYQIFNATDENIAEISGSINDWNFVVIDSSDKQIASIDKKWYEVINRVYRSPDKYNLQIAVNILKKDNKIAILSSSIIIGVL